MRFSKIANLGNAPAIHNQKIVVKTCQSPPADHQQPTEPTQSLCPVRACLAPISPQSTLLFNVIYQNSEKTKWLKNNSLCKVVFVKVVCQTWDAENCGKKIVFCDCKSWKKIVFVKLCVKLEMKKYKFYKNALGRCPHVCNAIQP